jgi:hypothetical protein
MASHSTCTSSPRVAGRWSAQVDRERRAGATRSPAAGAPRAARARRGRRRGARRRGRRRATGRAGVVVAPLGPAVGVVRSSSHQAARAPAGAVDEVRQEGQGGAPARGEGGGRVEQQRLEAERAGGGDVARVVVDEHDLVRRELQRLGQRHEGGGVGLAHPDLVAEHEALDAGGSGGRRARGRRAPGRCSTACRRPARRGCRPAARTSRALQRGVEEGLAEGAGVDVAADGARQPLGEGRQVEAADLEELHQLEVERPQGPPRPRRRARRGGRWRGRRRCRR